MSDLHKQMLKAMVRIQGKGAGTPGPEVAEQLAAYYDRKGFMRAVETLRQQSAYDYMCRRVGESGAEFIDTVLPQDWANWLEAQKPV